MNFKAYDILASLIPGFLSLLVLQLVLDIDYNDKLVVAYTAISFLLGYFINSVGSWLEDFYYLTWGGNPSTKLLNGKDTWKVRFYSSDKVKILLTEEANKPNPSSSELFAIAMRYANGNSSRVDDFNATYAFSRTLLTTVLIGTIILLLDNYNQINYYLVLIPILFACWLRCKQRNYYYCREVLNFYLKAKTEKK